MSLRDDCIQAATDEFRTCMADDELLGQIPVRLLDAILDTLSENALPHRAERLVAALRETETGPQ